MLGYRERERGDAPRRLAATRHGSTDSACGRSVSPAGRRPDTSRPRLTHPGQARMLRPCDRRCTPAPVPRGGPAAGGSRLLALRHGERDESPGAADPERTAAFRYHQRSPGRRAPRATAARRAPRRGHSRPRPRRPRLETEAIMNSPIRPISTARRAKAAPSGDTADPLGGLARRIHDAVNSDTGSRLAKARVGTWIHDLLDTLFPQAAEQVPGTPRELRDAFDASAAELRSLLRPLESEIETRPRWRPASSRHCPRSTASSSIDATGHRARGSRGRERGRGDPGLSGFPGHRRAPHRPPLLRTRACRCCRASCPNGRTSEPASTSTPAPRSATPSSSTTAPASSSARPRSSATTSSSTRA